MAWLLPRPPGKRSGCWWSTMPSRNCPRLPSGQRLPSGLHRTSEPFRAHGASVAPSSEPPGIHEVVRHWALRDWSSVATCPRWVDTRWTGATWSGCPCYARLLETTPASGAAWRKTSICNPQQQNPPVGCVIKSHPCLLFPLLLTVMWRWP